MIMIGWGCRSAAEKPGWYSLPHLGQLAACSPPVKLQTSPNALHYCAAPTPAVYFSATLRSIELRSSIWRANKQIWEMLHDAKACPCPCRRSRENYIYWHKSSKSTYTGINAQNPYILATMLKIYINWHKCSLSIYPGIYAQTLYILA